MKISSTVSTYICQYENIYVKIHKKAYVVSKYLAVELFCINDANVQMQKIFANLRTHKIAALRLITGIVNNNNSCNSCLALCVVRFLHNILRILDNVCLTIAH